MNTPRTDEKDKSLRGNFAMCYGVMVEFARGLERELATAISEQNTHRSAAAEAWNECHTARTQRDDAKRERDEALAALNTPNTALSGPEAAAGSGYARKAGSP